MQGIRVGIAPFAALAALPALAAAAALASSPAPERDLATWIGEVEAARGHRFVRPPRVEWLPAADFDAARAGLEGTFPIDCPAPGFALRRITSALADPAADRVLAAEEADARDVGVALAHLLDAQLHPELVREAAALGGDRGETLRALFAANACAVAQGGFGPAPEAPAEDPFPGPFQEVREPGAGSRLLVNPTAAASAFLQRQSDRDAVFRRPPISSAELLFPGRWERQEGATCLIGPALSFPGCRVTGDETLGVFSLVRELEHRGGRVPSGVFSGWEGDRAVRYACEDGRRPWVYVGLFARAEDAADFSAAAETLLSAELARPLEADADGRRAFAWHGLEAADTRAFAAALAAERCR